MNFLVDAMQPKVLSDFLISEGYDSIHTTQLQKKNKTTDRDLNQLSMQEQRIVITKDSDFERDILINKVPYKLLLVSTGNISNSDLLKLFRENIIEITDVLKNYSFIEINEFGIIRNF